MGFYLHKSVAVGPFRFNLSGAGVGMSVGVRGLRVGTGPRGNYVRMGRGGVYYQHTFHSPAAPRSVPSVTPRLLPSPQLPDRTHAPLQEIESGNAAQIADSSSEQLLAELRDKRGAISLTPFVAIGSILLTLLAAAMLPGWALLLLTIAAAIAIVAARRRDILRKTTVILYDFTPDVEEAYRTFTQWADALTSCGRMWHVAAEGRVYDRKYHAGATSLLQRNATTVRSASPPFVRTNVPVLSIAAGRQTLYFLPDHLLVYDGPAIGAVSYSSIDLAVARQRFIEDGGVPGDATVVDYTWRYVNKSGGPDRRFNNNPRIPICLYDELHFRTASGLNEVLQVSRSGIGEGFAAAVRHLGTIAT
ncbi:MAG: hypothetical protein QOC81_2939 [Thermoanaerobaculia bacterium]|jgi:hypothetical protein|nr:hypothetical protein [Thermoanaerobaculia bacterium]